MCHRTTATPLPPLSISRAGPVRDVGPSGHTDCHPGRAQGAATAPKAGTMFPTRDLIDGYERLLERDRVHQLLLEAHPDLFAEIEQLVRDNADKLYTLKKGEVLKRPANIDDAPVKAPAAAKIEDAAVPPAPAEEPAKPARKAKPSIDIMVED